jgi:hypothetical protein
VEIDGFTDYLEVNTFLSEAQTGFKSGKDYIMCVYMNKIFINKVRLFESIVEILRDDINLKNQILKYKFQKESSYNFQKLIRKICKV